jgi:hypothetical protein
MALANAANRAERLIYRIAGLPVAIAALFTSNSLNSDPLQSAFLWTYFHPEGADEWVELAGSLFVWPVALMLGALWYTGRNGLIIRRKHGRGIAAQFADQLRFYFSSGVLAPWYYTFSLYKLDGQSHARSLIQRFETKPCIFPLLKQRKGSPLNNKARFAEYCRDRHLRSIETIAVLDGRNAPTALPDQDLFVKPTTGRGGKGAERWDRLDARAFVNPQGERLTHQQLLARLVERSRKCPLIIQPRLKPHPELAQISTGALPTSRVVTCLDERGEPEVVAAMFRSSIGRNVTVDNMHAGGMGCLIDINMGRLGRASNIGADARLGWFSTHPDTGAPIEGRSLPRWKEVKELAAAAHQHFKDRVAVGWDIAVLEDGPILVEGNGNPDLDILQRFMPKGFREHRFGHLLAHHVRARLPAVSKRFAPEAVAP